MKTVYDKDEEKSKIIEGLLSAELNPEATLHPRHRLIHSPTVCLALGLNPTISSKVPERNMG